MCPKVVCEGSETKEAMEVRTERWVEVNQAGGRRMPAKGEHVQRLPVVGAEGTVRTEQSSASRS